MTRYEKPVVLFFCPYQSNIKIADIIIIWSDDLFSLVVNDTPFFIFGDFSVAILKWADDIISWWKHNLLFVVDETD
ncbi:hypothetical protein D3C71_1795510 [compost metagenome]